MTRLDIQHNDIMVEGMIVMSIMVKMMIEMIMIISIMMMMVMSIMMMMMRWVDENDDNRER